MDYTSKKEVMVKISNKTSTETPLIKNLSISSTYNKKYSKSKKMNSKVLELFTQSYT
jgi:hypothetical protein